MAEELSSVPPELANWIKVNAKDLKLRQTDRRWAAEVVNDFRENLLKFLRSSSDQPFFQSAEFLTTGSYFEKVKVYFLKATIRPVFSTADIPLAHLNSHLPRNKLCIHCLNAESMLNICLRSSTPMSST